MDKKLSLLIVDDEERTRSIYAEVLEGAGFEVSQAEDGLAGLEKVNQKKPDVIITGIIMPRMDGFAFVETLKKNTAFSGIPIIFLSHLGREEDRKRALELGVKNFVLRDMTPPKEMIRHVNALFGERDYFLAVEARSFDAPKLAKDFNFNSDFLCPEKEGARLIIKLRRREDASGQKQFDAEFVCK